MLEEPTTDQTCLDQAGLHLAETGQTNGLDRISAVNKTIKRSKIIPIQLPQRGILVSICPIKLFLTNFKTPRALWK